MAYVTWADLKTPNLGGPRGQTPRPADWDQLIDWQKLWPEDVNAGGHKVTNLAQIHGEGAGNTLGLWTAGVQRVWLAADGGFGIGSTPGGAQMLLRKDQNTLTYFDLFNVDAGANAGVIARFVTADAAGTGNGVVDMVKYKTGAFVISNGEPSAAAAAITIQTGATCYLQLLGTGRMRMTLPPAYANNAAAVAGGLSAGYLYRDGADPDRLCIVH